MEKEGEKGNKCRKSEGCNFVIEFEGKTYRKPVNSEEFLCATLDGVSILIDGRPFVPIHYNKMS